MDFGTYLKNALDNKNVNLSKLADAVGIKSKNTFYRLFDNYYSYDKAKEITDKIISAVEFTNEEKNRIYELMKICHIKKNVLNACRLLKKLYLPPAPADENIYRGGNSIWCRPTCEEIHMFMGYVDSDRPVAAAQEILDNSPAPIKTIKHFIDFSKSDLCTAGALFALIRLVSNDEYTCDEVNNIDFGSLIGLVKLKDGFCMFFTGSDGKYIESPISRELYDFIMNKYNSVIGKKLKFEKGRVTDYASIISEFAIIEENDSFSLEGMMCFGDIPFDTLYRLLSDANFLGLPPDSVYIKNLVDVTRKRYDMHISSSAKRTYVLSSDRIVNFLKTGLTMDHFELFRPLNSDEVKSMMQHFIDYQSRFEYRLFKPEFNNHCLECGIIYDKKIFIWDAGSGYGKNHFHVSITNPKALKLYKDFCEYFSEFCTLPEKESIQILTDIFKSTEICSEQ